jgi:DNA replication protein DnaC
MSQATNPKNLQGKVDLDSTKAALEQLGLFYMAERISDEIHEAVKEEMAPQRFLDKLLALEVSRREERRIKTSLRLSTLPTGQTLANFDFGFQRGVERSRIATLATCAWIREHATVLIQGPPGVGKTHLAVARGVKAIENGYSVSFYRLDDLLHSMKRHAGLPPSRLRSKKYFNSALLVVDEVGFQPMAREEAALFFRLVSYRYQRGATLITTNRAVNEWPEVLAGDEVMTTALLVLLLHNCHVVAIKGRSYRLKELEKMLK